MLSRARGRGLCGKAGFCFYTLHSPKSAEQRSTRHEGVIEHVTDGSGARRPLFSQGERKKYRPGLSSRHGLQAMRAQHVTHGRQIYFLP